MGIAVGIAVVFVEAHTVGERTCRGVCRGGIEEMEGLQEVVETLEAEELQSNA